MVATDLPGAVLAMASAAGATEAVKESATGRPVLLVLGVLMGVMGLAGLAAAGAGAAATRRHFKHSPQVSRAAAALGLVAWVVDTLIWTLFAARVLPLPQFVLDSMRGPPLKRALSKLGPAVFSSVHLVRRSTGWGRGGGRLRKHDAGIQLSRTGSNSSTVHKRRPSRPSSLVVFPQGFVACGA